MGGDEQIYIYKEILKGMKLYMYRRKDKHTSILNNDFNLRLPKKFEICIS